MYNLNENSFCKQKSENFLNLYFIKCIIREQLKLLGVFSTSRLVTFSRLAMQFAKDTMSVNSNR